MPASRIFFITLVFIFAVVYLLRLYKKGNAPNKSAVIKLVFFALLIPIPSIASALDLPFWLRPQLDLGPQYYGGVLCCLAIIQIIYNKIYVSIIKNGLFPVVTAIYIPLLILTYIEGNTPIPYTDNKPFPHTWSYYTITALDYLIMLYIAIYITHKLRARLKQDAEPQLRIRYTLAYIGTAAMVIGYMMVEASVLLSATWNDALLQTINNIYQYILILASLSFLSSFLTPQRVVMIIVKYQKTDTKNTQYQTLLHYLHQNLAKITPEVILQKDMVHTEDLVTEIADSLLIIRSCRKQSSISAQGEAREILALTQNREVLMVPNNHIEVPERYNNVTYYVTLAKQLKRLESQA